VTDQVATTIHAEFRPVSGISGAPEMPPRPSSAGSACAGDPGLSRYCRDSAEFRAAGDQGGPAARAARNPDFCDKYVNTWISSAPCYCRLCQRKRIYELAESVSRRNRPWNHTGDSTWHAGRFV
jgi:hypothetical protein